MLNLSDNEKVVNLTRQTLTEFCNAYMIPFTEENNWEIPNLTKEQIGVLIEMLPTKASNYYKDKIMIPMLFKKQNTMKKWWIRQLRLLFIEYVRLGWV